MDIQIPNIPDISGKAISQDQQLRDILVAIKMTLEKLTGTDENSNTALIDLLNANQ